MIQSLLVCEFGKGGQCILPHRVDVVTQFGQSLRIETEIVPRAASFLMYKRSGLQYVQMLRDSRPADRKPSCQLPDGAKALSKQVENGLASRIGEGVQQFSSVSHVLR